ncbi:MAG TPA: penicillin-binding protein [Cryomorphaceae bacterium]|nr:penicillin-binding protein [Owenweeksia sp.]HBF21513.1 penicillin-binding protein [Cryomorphaceae bacterium]HCQ15502.1 penicillin-binding protein [Cryomorphaceae bacterium]|tara:strand:- start:6802 stop:8613 length:1812 start_codon:yes stop_codon:yes gene_type:complete
MKKPVFITVLLLPLLYAGAQDVTRYKRLRKTDKELNQILQDWNVPGFAVAVVEKDKIIYSAGYGYRDFENKKPVTVNTLFPIGSSTKAFTATLLGQLEAQGELELTDRPAQYLPGFHFYNEGMDREISLLKILSHQTGLPRHDYSWYYFPSGSREELVERIAHQEPTAKVGEQWQYNNFMYLLAGSVAEQLKGSSWEEQVDERIFTPLEMGRSNTSIVEMAQDDDAAKGYTAHLDRDPERVNYYDIKGMSPAGAINSSVMEMSHWLMTWINGGVYQGKEVFSSAFYERAINPQIMMGGSPGARHPDIHLSSYGLGWFITSYRGHYRVEHGGNIDGFSSSVAFYPSDSIGIVVLVNENYSALPDIIRNTIADKLLDLEPGNWSEERLKGYRAALKSSQQDTTQEKDMLRKPGTVPSHPLEAFTGKFGHPGYGTLEIKLVNDTLLASTCYTDMQLRHYHYNVFDVRVTRKGEDTNAYDSGLKFNFQVSERGEIESFSSGLQEGLDPIRFDRAPLEEALETEEMMAYAGNYSLHGMVFKIFLAKDSALHMEVPGQPEYTLVPYKADEFNIEGLKGYGLRFIRNEESLIHKVLLMQPNGTFEAERKD